MSQTDRPHTRAFVSWLLVLLAVVVTAARLLTPAHSDARDQENIPVAQESNTKTVDGVVHAVDHVMGMPTERSITAQLAMANVTVAPEDRIRAFPDPTLGLGSSLTIERASEVTITDWGKSQLVRTWAPTVAALLEQQAVVVGDQDQISIDTNTTIEDKMTIVITRVEVTDIFESEPVAFAKTTVDDPAMERGETKVLKIGREGVRTKTYRVRRENGAQVEKTLVNSEITTEPIAQETAVGTHVTLYGTGKATWYALRHGYGAASNVLPYGTKVRVVNTANGKSVDVTIDDHGIQGSAIIDLDAEAFAEIAPLSQGVASVRLEKIYSN